MDLEIQFNLFSGGKNNHFKIYIYDLYSKLTKLKMTDEAKK